MRSVHFGSVIGYVGIRARNQVRGYSFLETSDGRLGLLEAFWRQKVGMALHYALEAHVDELVLRRILDGISSQAQD